MALTFEHGQTADRWPEDRLMFTHGAAGKNLGDKSGSLFHFPAIGITLKGRAVPIGITKGAVGNPVFGRCAFGHGFVLIYRITEKRD